MKYYKYSFKCKKCGHVVYVPKLIWYDIDECSHCGSKELKRRYLADFLRLYLFKWAIDNIRQIFWPAVLVIGVLCLWGGIIYSIYWFNENECDRVHNLGYETDFGFYGGCYVKVDGHWIPIKNHGVNVITEGK